jgi:hypothetical protein
MRGVPVWGAALLAGFAILATGSPAMAQKNPIEFLREWIAPPAKAPTQTFTRQQRTTTVRANDPVPAPRLRPAPLQDAGGAPVGGPTATASAAPAPRLRGSASAAAPAASCIQSLAQLGITAVAVAPVRGKGKCGITDPIGVTAAGGIAFSQRATLSCQTTKALAGWVNDHVRPAARTHLASDITGLRIAASYVCRTRNSQAGAKLSEHARGRAIDISAIEVGGEWLEVGQQSGSRKKFMAAIRQAACGPFTTVLGPGSDKHHTDHFHLDTARRRAGGKSLYCG